MGETPGKNPESPFFFKNNLPAKDCYSYIRLSTWPTSLIHMNLQGTHAVPPSPKNATVQPLSRRQQLSFLKTDPSQSMSARPREQVPLLKILFSIPGSRGATLLLPPWPAHSTRQTRGVRGCAPAHPVLQLLPETGDKMMIDGVRFCCISHKTVSVTIKWQGLKKRRMYSPIQRPRLHTTRAVHGASLVKNTSHRGSVIELTG